MTSQIFQIVAKDVVFFMVLGMTLYFSGVLNEKRNSFLLRYGIVGFLFPCFIFLNVSSRVNMDNLLSIFFSFFLSSGMILLAGAVSLLLVKVFRVLPTNRSSFLVSASFQNYGFLVYPLVFKTVGPEAMPTAFAYAIAGDFMIWTFGVFLANRGKPRGGFSVKETLKKCLNLPTVGFLSGILLSPVFYNDPVVIQAGELFYYSIPCALTIIGSIIAHALAQSFSKNGLKESLWLAGQLLISRLIIMPWVFYFTGVLFQIKEPVYYIEAMMPASVGINLLVALYGGNRLAVGLFTVASNLLAALSVPIYWSLWM